MKRPAILQILISVTALRAYQILLPQKTSLKMLEGGDLTSLSSVVNHQRDVRGVDYHYKRGEIYFSDNSGAIFRFWFRGKNNIPNPQMILKGNEIWSVAVDWINDNIYWADWSKVTIEMANLDELHPKVLFSKSDGVTAPTTIVVDPHEGLIFWGGNSKNILSSTLDGKDRKIIASSFPYPWGLALDLQNKLLYFSDYELKKLYSCKYDGSSLNNIYNSNLHIFGITYYSNVIYWYTDTRTLSTFNVTTDSPFNYRPSGAIQDRVWAIKAFDSSLQPDCLPIKPSDKRIMIQCVYKQNKTDVCFCPCGFNLSDDKKNCVREAIKYDFDDLKITIGDDYFRLSFSGSNRPTFVVLSLKCIEREACPNVRCSESATLTKVFSNTSVTPFTVSGLLPATKYLVQSSVTKDFIISTNNGRPQLPHIISVDVEDTRVTVKWDPVDACLPNFKLYNYALYRSADLERSVMEGSTSLTELQLINLQPLVNYTMQLFTSDRSKFTATSFTTKSEDYDISEDAHVIYDGNTAYSNETNEDLSPHSGIKNLFIYEKTKTTVSFRCIVTNQIKQSLIKFSGHYSIADSKLKHQFEKRKEPCDFWPESYCFNITKLRREIKYVFHVSAVLTNGSSGSPVSISVLTKEEEPGPPEDIEIVNYTSTNVVLKWSHPRQTNGILRNFIINKKEIESFEGYDESTSRRSYPITQVPVLKKSQLYYYKLEDLKPASTYAISVASENIMFGHPTYIEINTPPPAINILRLPELSVPSENPIIWQRRDDKPVEKHLYYVLIKLNVLLLFDIENNQTKEISTVNNSDPLHTQLKMKFGNNFSVLWNESVDDSRAYIDPIQVNGLTSRRQYRLAWVQVSKYKNVFGFDYIVSESFTAL